MTDPSTRYMLHPLASHREVGGEVFIVTDDRAFHRLAAPTAVQLFQQLAQGACHRDELVATLVGSFEVSPEQAATDVDEFLQALLDRLVIVCSSD